MQTESRVRARGPVWLLAVGAPLAAFVALAVRAATDEGFGWDEPVADAIGSIAPVSSSEVHVDPVLTTITLGVGALTVVLALALLVQRQLRATLFLVLALGGAVVLSRIAKAVVQRSAIEGNPGDYTFPSGSATWSMATAVAIMLLARTATERRRIASAGAALVLGFGWVIVWEEWHYPSDVVAGWCLAVGCVAALWLTIRPAEERKARGHPGRGGGRSHLADRGSAAEQGHVDGASSDRLCCQPSPDLPS